MHPLGLNHLFRIIFHEISCLLSIRQHGRRGPEGEQMLHNESALHPQEYLLIRVIEECLVEFSHKPPDCAFHLLMAFQHTSE